MFSHRTGTSGLWKHLCNNHPDIWIAGCDRLNIPITAQAAQHAVKDYHACQGAQSANPTSDDKPSQPFTPDAFVDAIVEFIVADDQVNDYYSIVFM
jgi:hypothetical protein